MATAPKAAPKVVPIEEGKQEAASESKKSKKKLVILLGIALLALGGGGGAWYFMGEEGGEGVAKPAKVEPPKPPVFLQMEQFTVNLQSVDGSEQYLQVAFTLQVADAEQVELVKLYMPLVRSRMLLLLSSKKASDINTEAGKLKLQEEIIAQVKKPFTPQSKPVGVNGVFFTSFVIQ